MLCIFDHMLLCLLLAALRLAWSDNLRARLCFFGSALLLDATPCTVIALLPLLVRLHMISRDRLAQISKGATKSFGKELIQLSSVSTRSLRW